AASSCCARAPAFSASNCARACTASNSRAGFKATSSAARAHHLLIGRGDLCRVRLLGYFVVSCLGGVEVIRRLLQRQRLGAGADCGWVLPVGIVIGELGLLQSGLGIAVVRTVRLRCWPGASCRRCGCSWQWRSPPLLAPGAIARLSVRPTAASNWLWPHPTRLAPGAVARRWDRRSAGRN